MASKRVRDPGKVREYNAGWRARNKDYWKKKRQERKAELLAGRVCACGESHPATLHFHHRDPATKLFTIGKRFDAPDEELQAEIAKCDVLCANCHAKAHYSG